MISSDLFLEQLMLLIISLVANGLSALAGGGAGLLQLPVLLFLGLGFGTALATHKIASVALGIGATLRHIREGKLDYRFCAFMVGCGLPGVLVGAFVVLTLPEGLIIFLLGLLTLFLGLYSVSKKQFGLTYEPKHRDRFGYIVGGSVIFAIGFLNGSLTSGTGLFVTLWLVRWFGFDYQRAVVYVLILVGLFWNGTGAIAVASQVAAKWEWLPALLIGATGGAYLGAHLSLAKGSKLIKHVFEVLTMLVGVKLVYDGWLLL